MLHPSPQALIPSVLERVRSGFGSLPPPTQDLLSDYCSRLKRLTTGGGGANGGGGGGGGNGGGVPAAGALRPEHGAFVQRLGLVVLSRMRYPRSTPATDTDPMAAEIDETARTSERRLFVNPNHICVIYC